MKRAHRRWHRRIGWVLVPGLALIVSLITVKPDAPPDNSALPPVLTRAPSGEAP